MGVKTEVLVTVIEPASRTFGERVISFAGAIVALMVVPAAIFLLGIPVALAARAVIELTQWAIGMFTG
jgi:hypothetical protein